MIVLTDDNASSIWSTSVYSYAPGGGGPGGGLADDRLRVGGWGDTYVSFLRFDLPDRRRVRRAVLRLMVKGDDPKSRPTPMMLGRVRSAWTWKLGDRLWWKDRPPIAPEVAIDAPRGGPGATYDIDITHIYNSWIAGTYKNHGIALEPLWTDNAYSTFFSTRGSRCAKPELVLTG